MSTTVAASAANLAANDHLAAAYVAKRLRELQALQADLADPNNGYATVTKTKTGSGVEIRTATETVMAVSVVAAQAYVLARFW